MKITPEFVPHPIIPDSTIWKYNGWSCARSPFIVPEGWFELMDPEGQIHKYKMIYHVIRHIANYEKTSK